MSELSLSEQIYQVLKNNRINDQDIKNTLFKVQNEMESMLWEKVIISPDIFYKLKDTIFFNFEHLCNCEDLTGITSLKYFASKYPVLMLGMSPEHYYVKEYINNLLDELDDIMTKWNDQIYIAQLYSKRNFDWRIGENNPSEMIVYLKNKESPSKYGYYNNDSNTYGNIVDVNGMVIKKKNEIVLCSIEQINMYNEYNLFTQLLNKIYDATKIAQKNNKGLYLDFNSFDYQN